jgi:uncharacterized protein (TIGR02569 family)
MIDHQPPPEAVLRAFGAAGERPVRFAEGKGGAWRAGYVVVKPSEGEEEARWRAGVLASLPESPHFRVAVPVRAVEGEGDWIAYGWEATRLVEGRADRSRVADVVRAGEAFHAALAGVARPGFLDRRANPWVTGERLAWEGEGPRRPSRLLDELLALRRPIAAANQVIHPDLLGNVLFAAGLPPAIIDWPVYWRPPTWATAVAVVDATVWNGYALGAARRWEPVPDWWQLVLRAAIFRLATWDAAGWAAEPEDAYVPIVRELTGRLL